MTPRAKMSKKERERKKERGREREREMCCLLVRFWLPHMVDVWDFPTRPLWVSFSGRETTATTAEKPDHCRAGATPQAQCFHASCLLQVMAAAQSRCDPLTQYEESGRCCKMCGPGTRMSGRGTCLDPQCKECGENEYQDKFTTEEKCQLQPYCDTNKNFQYVAGESKKIRKTCTCAPGFHCSSAACITCVPHTVCKPGHGAQSVGNHTHDTVCQTCPKGTFSKESSWESVCKKWTECGEGYHIKHSGTDTSDNTCEETSRQHTVLIALISVFVLAVVVAGLIFCQCRGDAKRKLKDCVQSCRGERLELQNENPLIAPPVDDAEKELMFPEQQSSQEEGGTRTPEENEDELSEEISAGVILTDNGNYVTQEKGKTEILSRQESETQTFAD